MRRRRRRRRRCSRQARSFWQTKNFSVPHRNALA